MEDDIEKTIKTNLEELVDSKSERQKTQISEFKKYSSYVKKNKLCEGPEIILLWKKLAEELNSGRNIRNLESDTKDRILKHYEYLILETVNKLEKNFYLTPLELINEIKERFYDTIASLGYEVLNETIPQRKEMSEKLFLDRFYQSAYSKSEELIFWEGQKALGYNHISYFIYKNKDGTIDKISYCENDGKTQTYGVFVGTNEEKKKFAEEYKEKQLILKKLKEEFCKIVK